MAIAGWSSTAFLVLWGLKSLVFPGAASSGKKVVMSMLSPAPRAELSP